MHEWALLLRVVDPFGVLDNVSDVSVDMSPAARRLRAWRGPHAHEDLEVSEDDGSSTLRRVHERRRAAEQAAGLPDTAERQRRRKAEEQEERLRQQADNEAADAAAERIGAELLRAADEEEDVHNPVRPSSLAKPTTWAEVEKEL